MAKVASAVSDFLVGPDFYGGPHIRLALPYCTKLGLKAFQGSKKAFLSQIC